MPFLGPTSEGQDQCPRAILNLHTFAMSHAWPHSYSPKQITIAINNNNITKAKLKDIVSGMRRCNLWCSKEKQIFITCLIRKPLNENVLFVKFLSHLGTRYVSFFCVHGKGQTGKAKDKYSGDRLSSYSSGHTFYLWIFLCQNFHLEMFLLLWIFLTSDVYMLNYQLAYRLLRSWKLNPGSKQVFYPWTLSLALEWLEVAFDFRFILL